MAGNWRHLCVQSTTKISHESHWETEPNCWDSKQTTVPWIPATQMPCQMTSHSASWFLCCVSLSYYNKIALTGWLTKFQEVKVKTSGKLVSEEGSHLICEQWSSQFVLRWQEKQASSFRQSPEGTNSIPTILWEAPPFNTVVWGLWIWGDINIHTSASTQEWQRKPSSWVI
jgi:hypothetical protein